MQALPHLFNQNLRLLLQMYDNGKYNFNRDELIRSSRNLFQLQINKNFSEHSYLILKIFLSRTI